MTRARAAQTAALLVGVYYVVFGLWALVLPGPFYNTVASFNPFNVHFLHDAGAFQIGLGLALVLVVAMQDGLAAVALAVGTASILHAVSHVVDLSLGGHPITDIPALLVIALVLGFVAAARLGARHRSAPQRSGSNSDGTNRAGKRSD